MRQITQQAIRAFISGQSFSRDNTRTQDTGGHYTLFLHDNAIARWGRETGYEVNFCSWPTVTTKERLNGLTYLLDHCNLFHTVKGVLCADGEPIAEDGWLKLSDFLGHQL